MRRVRGGTDQVSVCGRFCLFHAKVLRGGFPGRLAATHDRQQADKQQSTERSEGNHGGGHGALGGWVCGGLSGRMEVQRSHWVHRGVLPILYPSKAPPGGTQLLPDIWLQVPDIDQKINVNLI